MKILDLTSLHPFSDQVNTTSDVKNSSIDQVLVYHQTPSACVAARCQIKLLVNTQKLIQSSFRNKLSLYSSLAHSHSKFLTEDRSVTLDLTTRRISDTNVLATLPPPPPPSTFLLPLRRDEIVDGYRV
jgi:hypothetical protein